MTKEDCIKNNEWIYFKVYCNELVSNKILKEIHLIYFTWELNEEWFFLRYYDNYHHLRIRFKSIDKDIMKRFIEDIMRLKKKFNNCVHSVVLSDYKREVEKYDLFDYGTTEDIVSKISLLFLFILLLKLFGFFTKEEIRVLKRLIFRR